MPTVNEVWIDADAVGAGDGTSQADAYTTPDAAVAGEGYDLVAADEILWFHLAGGSTTLGGTVQLNSAYTTDATRYVLFAPASADMFDGEWDDNKPSIEGSVSTMLDLDRDMKMVGVQVKATGGGSQTCMSLGAGGSNLREFLGCMLWNSGTGGSTDTGFVLGATGQTPNIGACVIKGFNSGLFSSRASGSPRVYRSTIVDCDTAINFTSTAEPVVKGTLFSGNTTDITGTANSASDYNATNNASLGYTANTNDRVSQTFTFESGSENYMLAAGDLGAKGFGPDLSADGLWALSAGLQEVAWSSPFDIGAFQTDNGPAEQPMLRLRARTAAGADYADTTGITLTVYDEAGGTELFQTDTAAISSGVISIQDGAIGSVDDDVYYIGHKDGASDADDIGFSGDGVVVEGTGTDYSDGYTV